MTLCSRTIGYCFPIVFWKFNSETGYWNVNLFPKQAVEIFKNGHLLVILHLSAPPPRPPGELSQHRQTVHKVIIMLRNWKQNNDLILKYWSSDW